MGSNILSVGQMWKITYTVLRTGMGRGGYVSSAHVFFGPTLLRRWRVSGRRFVFIFYFSLLPSSSRSYARRVRRCVSFVSLLRIERCRGRDSYDNIALTPGRRFRRLQQSRVCVSYVCTLVYTNIFVFTAVTEFFFSICFINIIVV